MDRISYPLTSLQRAIVLQTLAAPAGGLEILQALVLPPRPLHREPLVEAWRRALRRHAALRTCFALDDLRRPAQRVHPEVPLPWSELDVTEVLPADRRRLIEELSGGGRRVGFPLDRPPLWRLVTVGSEGSPWALLFIVHHAILDGWSMHRLLQEVFAEYASLREGRPSGLCSPRPFEDFVRWLTSRDLRPARRFWTRYLDGSAPARLEALRRRPDAAGGAPGPGAGYRERRVRLPADSTHRIRRSAERSGITVHTLVRSLWGLLLARSTGADDVVFGEVLNLRGRSLPGASSMVGLLINAVAVRVRVEPGAKLASWLRGLHRDWRQIRRYAYTPAERIHAWTGMARSRRLFETLMVYDRSPPQASLVTALGEVELRTRRRPGFPLVLAAWEDGALGLRLGFDERIEETAAARLLHRLRWLLESASGALERKLADLPALPPAELHQLLFEWSAAPPAAAGTIPARFAGRAAAAPEAVALVDGRWTLTYGEVEARAGLLARRLRARGVARGSVVGTEAVRSATTVVALLAILEAGGAYLPVDPGEPDRRLPEILGAAGARHLLATAGAAARFQRGGVQVLPFDQPAARRAGAPPATAASGAGDLTAGDLAYVLFTSGSTGRPKAVAVAHGPVVQLACDPAYARIGPRDSLLQAAPLAFDASTFEIWGGLLNGARLVAAPPDPLSLEGLVETVERERVTVLWLTAGLFHAVPRRELPRLRRLRYLLAGGDSLSVGRTREVVAALQDTALVNGYGPTEATTFTTCHRVSRPPAADEPSVPIGRPIDGMRVHLLDPGLRPVPIGCPGQLWIGGEGLARGYLGSPAETAAAFIPDPWPEAAGARLYRTGDRVRRLPGGELDFCGRLDRQVKIRGYRIEPGEVEGCLRRHPDLAGAAVAAVEAPAGGRRLAAYVVPTEGGRPEPRGLHAYLRGRLPPHMVPSAFHFLAELPLTPSGKVDYRALPEPGPPPAPRSARRPTPLESRLMAIWSEVLGVGDIGPDDDFFELGGHSLVAMLLVARVREELGVGLTLRRVLEGCTPAAMAAAVERLREEPGGRPGPEAFESVIF